MYDAREKAIQKRDWELSSTFREGERKGGIKGEIRTIHTLQELLGVPLADESGLQAMTLEELRATTSELQQKLRGRKPL